MKAEVFDLGRLTGDSGPCDSPDCPERATHKVQIVVASVHTLGYVCDEHYDRLLFNVTKASYTGQSK